MKAVQRGPENCARACIFAARGLLCASLLLTIVMGSAETTASEPDTRLVFGSTSPQWLRAVGRLQVSASRYKNGRKEHHLEDCSATLVTDGSGSSADTVVTAWHCLEFYRDLSRPISFITRDSDGVSLHREAYRLPQFMLDNNSGNDGIFEVRPGKRACGEPAPCQILT